MLSKTNSSSADVFAIVCVTVSLQWRPLAEVQYCIIKQRACRVWIFICCGFLCSNSHGNILAVAGDRSHTKNQDDSESFQEDETLVNLNVIEK